MIDTCMLDERNLKLKEILTLMMINDDPSDTELPSKVKESLQDKNYIKLISENNKEIIIIREKGKLLIDELQNVKTQSSVPKRIVKEIPKRVNIPEIDFTLEFRSLWKGLKVGSQGSPKACHDKLQRWMTENPDYSKSDILKAAKMYIKSVDNYKYLQSAEYFIYKKDGKEESSRLSSFIDEIDGPEDDWTIKLS